MRKLIKQKLREGLEKQESLKDFYDRFKKTNENPNFLENNFKNPEFELRLTSEGGVKKMETCYSEKNRCETNTFNIIKQYVKNDDHRYFPVSGWIFLDSTSYYEHFWVYDAVNNLFLEVTPLDKLGYAYGGVINKNINNEILNAEKYSDVRFLLGKTGHSLYQKHIDNDSKPKLDRYNQSEQTYDEKLFNYINKTPEYESLKIFVNSEGIDNLVDLQRTLPKLKELQSNTRNNRDYDYFDLIIKQINGLIKK